MKNTILFDKGKIILQVFLVVLFQLTSTTCQLNLYNTDLRLKRNALQFDCLNYRTRRAIPAYHGLSDVIEEVIPYCFRPVDHLDELFEAFVDPRSQELSFEQLRTNNIDSNQLISWSIPIELVERYQLYLNNPNTALNEHIYNCTQRQFGLQCRYSFEFADRRSFEQIVESDFSGRQPYSELSDVIVQVPCYVLLSCHRNGQPWCLDWREVCDGKVDCFDEQLDEKSCFDMEVNECSDDEYRCHNGLCISQDLWQDGEGDTDCLDRSDRAADLSYINFCYQDPTFRCEEHSCRPGAFSFSCGDGECVATFQDCHDGRHVLLIDSMAVKGNLTNLCWISMICLTGLTKKVNGTLCEIWLMNDSNVYTALKQCDSFFQFPTTSVRLHHIRLFYKDLHLRSKLDQFFLPDYVCYDQQLCDFIVPDLVHETLRCINISKLGSILQTTKSWAQLISLIERHFRACSSVYIISHDRRKYDGYLSLYNCQNSQKFISKHRIMDNIDDCFEKDDEYYENSCSLNDRYRLKCQDISQCWSPIVKDVACTLSRFDDFEEISFQSVCDGISLYFHDDNGTIHSDEFGCGNWSCNNMYARCDGFWTCSDGRDEDNCTRPLCPSQTFACLSSVNYTMICLAPTFINNGRIDCVGALDEQVECRQRYFSKGTSYPFLCPGGGRCLQISQLCDNESNCAGSDDENKELCQNQRLTCDQNLIYKRSQTQDVLCQLNEIEKRKVKYFSVYTSHNYPSLDNNLVTEFNLSSEERRSIPNNNIFQLRDNTWPWYCNRGRVVYISTKNNNKNNRACLCPPSYYGRFCQYQNQRVSLTLRLTSNDRHVTYAVIIMLLDNNDERQEIDAHDQFTYIVKESCSMKLNRYLLYPSRPKNISKNYSVRIDVFEKSTLTYIGSWHFPIAFLFLPVNRLSVSLNLSNHLLQRSSDCLNNCIHGECIKYVNKAEYFCRCLPNWSGIQCTIPIHCQNCSSESICIGTTEIRSICVCPMGRSGQQCQLTSVCPVNACQNDGECVPADVTIPGSNYSCICSDQFFGEYCQHRKATLAVSFNQINIPAYLVAYFFTLSNKSEPVETIVLRKLGLFQQNIIFHVEVPFQLTFIQTDDKYYLAVLQQSPKAKISTKISPTQECISVEELLNSTVLNLIPYQRIIHFHYLCQTNLHLTCFIDETYLCLCTNDHHANCMKFNHKRDFQCPLNTYCKNEGNCLQDHPTCPVTQICLCPNCFFGNQCQFYAKGLGSTLDEILGYEIKSNTNLSKQSITIKITVIITTIICGLGIFNSIIAIMVFSRKKSQEVGSGIYLLASSITSLITMILFKIKFWFLLFSHQNFVSQQNIFQANCFFIEPLLKGFLYFDNWLNACVAMERTVSVIQGVTFDKTSSKRVAVRIIIFLFLMIVSLFIPQLMQLYLFYDQLEERSWCVIKYTPWLATYNTVLILIHYFLPLIINIISIICTMVISARQRATIQTALNFWEHLKLKVRKNKHVLMSPCIIICLTLPYLIISMILDCQKTSHLLWFYLIGYFLSFCPAACIFFIFILPSKLYRKEWDALKKPICRQ